MSEAAHVGVVIASEVYHAASIRQAMLERPDLDFTEFGKVLDIWAASGPFLRTWCPGRPSEEGTLHFAQLALWPRCSAGGGLFRGNGGARC